MPAGLALALAAITVEWAVQTRFFAAELRCPPGHQAAPAAPHLPHLPVKVLGAATVPAALAASTLMLWSGAPSE